MLFSADRRASLLEAAGTITVASAKAALNKETFRLDSKDQSRMVRMANVSSGVSIKESAKAKLVKKTRQIEPSSDRFYWVVAYRGEDPKGRWLVSPNFDNLKDAVAWANEHAEAAAAAYESKQEAKSEPKSVQGELDRVKAFLMANDPASYQYYGEYEFSGSLKDRVCEIVYNHAYGAATGRTGHFVGEIRRSLDTLFLLAKREKFLPAVEKAWKDGLEDGGEVRIR